jgi:hypothetical protein
LVRNSVATQRPEEEEVGSLARAYARFAPNFGPGLVGNGAIRAENGPHTISEAPLQWNFATACLVPNPSHLQQRGSCLDKIAKAPKPAMSSSLRAGFMSLLSGRRSATDMPS